LTAKYSADLLYKPLSNEETDRNWENIIDQHQPRAIIFGLQAIDEKKLAYWRRVLPNHSLKFVRKGTSLHRVDFAAARRHNVVILNTPGVNAPYVAKFIVHAFSSQTPVPSTAAVLGIGDIGKKVVTGLLETYNQLILFNRTQYPFDGDGYTYENNLLTIFSSSSQIAVCLPLTEETKGIIEEQHIRAMPENGQIVCVSPPRVFSPQAIKALHERSDIHVTFDHVASGLIYIHEALGHAVLRPNFIFDEKAAAGYECQYAMGEAAILEALK
jgi:phosphoglycerate dehydrogenase-like enzyme